MVGRLMKDQFAFRVVLSINQKASLLFGEAMFNGRPCPGLSTGIVRASSHFLISE